MEPFDLVVIGSGPGGYVAALRAAALGLKVASVEKGDLGGTCLNVGCIPSKALLRSSELYHLAVHGLAEHGIEVSSCRYRFATMQARKEKVVSGFRGGIAALLRKAGVQQFQGIARLATAQQVAVESASGEQILDTKSILLATGSIPTALPFAPFDEQHILSSTGALALKEVPKKLIVVGAGVIGVEMASIYSRLGSEVVLVEFLERICPTLDLEIGRAFQKILEESGLRFFLSSKVIAIEPKGAGVLLRFEREGRLQELAADAVLVAVGRKPYSEGLGLEKLGIATTAQGFIQVDPCFRTTQSNIFAIGDLIEGPMLAHRASEEGICVASYLAGKPAHPVDLMAIPSVIYTEPEVAAVGLTEEQARALGRKVKTGKFPFQISSRGCASGEDKGMVKLVCDEASGILLGGHILGSHASEMIGELVLAIEKRMKVSELAFLPHAHPTLAEAIKEAALAALGVPLHR